MIPKYYERALDKLLDQAADEWQPDWAGRLVDGRIKQFKRSKHRTPLGVRIRRMTRLIRLHARRT